MASQQPVIAEMYSESSIRGSENPITNKGASFKSGKTPTDFEFKAAMGIEGVVVAHSDPLLSIPSLLIPCFFLTCPPWDLSTDAVVAQECARQRIHAISSSVMISQPMSGILDV